MSPILLFANIFWTNALTGEKPFSDYAAAEWLWFLCFLLTELLLLGAMYFFLRKAYGILDPIIEKHREASAYEGIDPQDYDYIWFDHGGERALIREREGVFYLTIQDYNKKTALWETIDAISVHQSLNEIRRLLFFECDFFCEENTIWDKHGNEIFKSGSTTHQ